MRKNGNPEPIFYTDDGSMTLLVTLPVHPDFINNPLNKNSKTTQETTQEILILIKENPHITRKEIAKQLNNITEDGVKYNLSKLKKQGILQRIGSTKKGYWSIQKKQT